MRVKRRGNPRASKTPIAIIRRRSGTAIVLAALLSGCQSPPASYFQAKNTSEIAEQPAGKNQVGESCHYQLSSDTGGDFASYYVFCGTWEQPSGRILLGKVDLGEGGLDQAATNSLWRSGLDQRIVCGAPTRTNIVNGAPAALLQCTRRTGGWPQLAFVTELGGRTFYADGVPSAFPALETTVQEISGIAAPTATSRSSAADLIRSTIARNPFGSNELARYDRLRRLGEFANDVGDFASAERSYREALAIQEKLGADSASVAETVASLAIQVSNQGRFPEAEALLEHARHLLAEHLDYTAQAKVDLAGAMLDGNRDRLNEAESGADRAINEFEALVPPQFTAPRERAGSLKGVNYRKSTDSIAASLFLSPEEQVALSGYGTALQFKAFTQYQQGAYDAAEETALRARAVLKLAGVAPSGIAPRAALVAAASARNKKEYDGAEARLKAEEAALKNSGSNEPMRAELLMYLGEIEALRLDNAAALSYYDQGVALADTLAKQPDYSGLSDRAAGVYLAFLDDQAVAQPAAGEEWAEKAFKVVQLVKSDETAQLNEAVFARLANTDPKASDLIRTIQDDDLKLKRLRLALDSESAGPQNETSKAEIERLSADIAQTEKLKSDAEDAAPSASPEYGKLASSGVSLQDLREHLGPKEGLLEFFAYKKQMQGILVTRSTVRSFPVPEDIPALSASIAALRHSIIPSRSGPDAGQLPQFDTGGAYRLYTTLLGPVEKDLQALDRLVVAPAGPIGSLPLEVLVDKETAPVTDGNYAGVPFIIEKLAVSYTPSIRSFLLQRSQVQASKAPKPYIGFGDFRPPSPAQVMASFPGDECREDRVGIENLEPLPRTGKEVGYIGHTLFHVADSDVVLGHDFTKARVQKPDIVQYKLVHFATHGLLPTDLSCRHQPGIILSVAPADPNADGAFLEPGDIQALKLDADLVILSACNTGVLGANSSENLSVLAQSFFYAQARGLLVTHWELSDTSGPLLTALTLNGNSTSGDTAEALRQAKLLVIHKIAARFGSNGAYYTHPFAWAPFVLYGDGVHGSPAS